MLAVLGGLVGGVAGGSSTLHAQGASPREIAAEAGRRLVDAERELSAQSAEVGFTDALRAVLGSRSTLFGEEGALPGARWAAEAPRLPGRFTWGPDFAELSPDATLAFSTGPYRYEEGERTDHGRLLTIWRADGSDWRVELQVGVATPGSTVPEAPVVYTQDLETLGRPLEGGTVAEVDRRFAARERQTGFTRALDPFGAHRVRVLRAGRIPRVGPGEVEARPVADPALLESRQLGGACSTDGHLCWLHGRWGGADARSGVWVRIWRRHVEGGWSLLVDLRREDLGQ